MPYSVLIRKQPKGGYIATALAWPEFVAEAATRAEALKRIQELLTQLVTQGELVEVEVPLPPPHVAVSYKDTFGMFRNDPTFKAFVAATNAYRRKRNSTVRN